MFVAALILIIIVVLVVLAMLFTGGNSVTFGPDSLQFDASASAVFFLGMFTLLLAVVALGLLRSGARRASARRADRKKVSELSNKLDAYRAEERDGSSDPERRTTD